MRGAIHCGRDYREITAKTSAKSGWNWGCVSAIDSNEGTIWIVDARRDNGKHFVLRADGKLTAFMELEGGASLRAR